MEWVEEETKRKGTIDPLVSSCLRGMDGRIGRPYVYVCRDPSYPIRERPSKSKKHQPIRGERREEGGRGAQLGPRKTETDGKKKRRKETNI